MRFNPNLKKIIEEMEMDPLIVIPKNGGLKDIVSRTLKDMGVDYLNFEKIDRNNYQQDGLRVQIYRGEDIPKVVEEYYFGRRVKAIGFTGDDLFDEFRLKNPQTIVQVIETIDWDADDAMYRRPRLSFLFKQQPKGKVDVAVNKKYEQTSRQALDEIKDVLGIQPQVKVYSGNTEDTVISGLNDAAIEIVYSGKSAEKSGLSIGRKIRYSDFVVVGVDETSPLIYKLEYEQIQDRINNPRPDSYTSRLAADKNKLAKKPGEETTELDRELALYDADGNPARIPNIVGEFCDMLFAYEANLAARGIGFEQNTRELYQRRKQD